MGETSGREDTFVAKSFYPELDEIIGGFGPGEVALAISLRQFKEGEYGPLGGEFAMHMAYEAALAKARVTIASLAVEEAWAIEWMKTEVLLHHQDKVVAALLGTSDNDLAAFAARKLKRMDVRYLCRENMTLSGVESELAYPAAVKPGFLSMVGCLSCETPRSVELSEQYLQRIRSTVRQSQASAVVSLDVHTGIPSLDGTLPEITQNVSAALPGVMDLSDHVLVICRGPENGGVFGDEPTPARCHVIKSVTGATGTALLKMDPEHRGVPKNMRI